MDLGIWLCVGKVLGTPWHPFVDGYLPPCALVCVWSIKEKCWINKVQMSQRCQAYINWWCTNSTWSVLLSFIPLLNIWMSLRFLVKQWQGILGTLSLFTRTKLNWFGHYHDLIFPWVARAKRFVVWRLGLTYLFLGYFPHLFGPRMQMGFLSMLTHARDSYD